MSHCTVVGDVTIDTYLMIDDAHLACNVHGSDCQICFDFGGKIPIKDSHQAIGGNAANVSSALRLLGHEVSIVTELGDDFNGHEAYQALSSLGVDMKYVRQKRGAETRYSIIVNFESERTVFAYHAPRTYSLPRLKQTNWMYYTSLGASFESVQKKIISYKTKHSETKLAVNPGSYQMHAGIASFRSILPYVDILFVNKEEANMLLNEKKSIRASAKKLAEIGVTTVVITDGEFGSYTFHEGTLWHMPVFPLPPKSKTGAGDAYAAAFLAAIMYEKDFQTAMQWGTANATMTVQKIGSQAGQLKKRQMAAVLKTYKSIVPEII